MELCGKLAVMASKRLGCEKVGKQSFLETHIVFGILSWRQETGLGHQGISPDDDAPG